MPRELHASYIATLIAFLTACASLFFLPLQIPLWYSLAIPEQRLVPKIFIFFLPLCMLAINATH